VSGERKEHRWSGQLYPFSLHSSLYLAQADQQVVQVVVRLLLRLRHGGVDAGGDGGVVEGRGCVGERERM
jgi:hypothetical protein